MSTAADVETVRRRLKTIQGKTQRLAAAGVDLTRPLDKLDEALDQIEERDSPRDRAKVPAA